MKEIIQQIVTTELNEHPLSIKEIIGLGSVNKVYEITARKNSYIVRANTEKEKEIEYQKEAWCLESVKRLGVPSPVVLKLGKEEGVNYMILQKIDGINGKHTTYEERLKIWKSLGTYAKSYHELKRIAVDEFEKNEFHSNWRGRLAYNINQLNDNDSMLKRMVLSKSEQHAVKLKLRDLTEREFEEGLVHGDLCPRNVLFSAKGAYLLDWGTAEINIVPHHEIGLVMLSKEASAEEFKTFLKGLEISNEKFRQMKADIAILNLLHRLDKYRWAESYDVENIQTYGTKIREALEEIK